MSTFALLFLEKICEAIYFALFMIYGKNIKEKKLLFTGIMIFEYLALKQFIHYNVWFQIIYTFVTYIILKILYKEKTQITDLFLFAISSLLLILISVSSYLIILITFKKYVIALILNRIILFFVLFLFKNNINIYYKKFYKLWNRHNNKNKIKSLTIRNISVITFNIMFCILNFCIFIFLTYFK